MSRAALELLAVLIWPATYQRWTGFIYYACAMLFFLRPVCILDGAHDILMTGGRHAVQGCMSDVAGPIMGNCKVAHYKCASMHCRWICLHA